MAALDQYQYLLLMAGCLLVTLPLEFVFGARVWRQPRRLLIALVPTAVLFAAWDIGAIAREHWTFNAQYVTGRRLPGNLPVEELVFFIVIPICGLLARYAGSSCRRDRWSASPAPTTTVGTCCPV